ncbi:39S ribosomal protein L32, mitochondrial [Leguminivora glycinivorella]|uniref:39S ribosomal protein L32, mitochondrial n=1 Tax=Leguminivora glycinivorella TaxID=1035111 RepID=UPI00200FB85D|nr:39S ribosomal protein L32, mitochondrial [Leguminivora glycinivorella]
MLPRISTVVNILRNIEKCILSSLGHPPNELALAYVYEPRAPTPKKFSIKDIVGDGFLLAVPKFRRTVEKRLKRKFGNPDYIWKPLVPQTNIRVCRDCGHHHESGRLCEHCYKKIQEETKLIQEQIKKKLGVGPITEDVVILYEGENLPEKAKEFWNGKRVVEMKKERPQWFSKNLLQKSTQQPSNSTDVKPTDLA